MATLRYITHPEVTIEPSVPVVDWDLSATGHRRATEMLSQTWVGAVGRVLSSDERKARTTAGVLADHLGLTVDVRPDTGENDRSATGFVPPAQFEALADAFFSHPEESIQGWERAVDAQSRIVEALGDVLAAPNRTDVAVVGHGGVGTLLYCHLAGLPIDRRFDQPGQGHYFSVNLANRQVLHGWQPIDQLDSKQNN